MHSSTSCGMNSAKNIGLSSAKATQGKAFFLMAISSAAGVYLSTKYEDRLGLPQKNGGP